MPLTKPPVGAHAAPLRRTTDPSTVPADFRKILDEHPSIVIYYRCTHRSIHREGYFPAHHIPSRLKSSRKGKATMADCAPGGYWPEPAALL